MAKGLAKRLVDLLALLSRNADHTMTRAKGGDAMIKATWKAAALCVLLVCSGCATQGRIRDSISPKMNRLGLGTAAPKPPADRSVVVFMRPAITGYGVQSSVFELRPDEDQLVGIVSALSRVAYVATPGQHLFMVIGENADFMTADLAAGKTYYVLVSPRMGWVKARFSLEPIRRPQMSSADFAEWHESTVLVENTNQSYDWSKLHWPSIQDKKTDYMRKWEGRSPDERRALGLLPEDGVE
jgi:hypothetical protein